MVVYPDAEIDIYYAAQVPFLALLSNSFLNIDFVKIIFTQYEKIKTTRQCDKDNVDFLTIPVCQ